MTFAPGWLASIAIAVGIGGLLAARRSSAGWLERAIVALLPMGALAFAWRLFVELASMPFFGLNASRLSWSVALAKGHELYPPEGVAPFVDYAYAPGTSVAFLPAALLPTPTSALLAGGVMAFAYALVPPAVIYWRARAALPVWICVAAFVAFLGLVMFDSGLGRSAFLIHADAPSLGFCATAAACVLWRRDDPEALQRALLGAALFSALAVWTKQSALTMPAALLLHLWLTDGFRVALRFGVYAFVAALGLGVLFALQFDPWLIFYNIVIIPMGMIAKDSVHVVPWPDATLRLVASVAAPLLLCVVAVAASWSREEGLRAWLRANPWTLFLTVAIVTTPLSLSAFRKIGGHINSFSFTTMFVLMAASLGIATLAATAGWRRRLGESLLLAVLVTTTGTALFTGDLANRALVAYQRFRSIDDNPQEAALRFLRTHPGKVYLPLDPLPGLLNDGSLYNMALGSIPKKLAGVETTDEQYFAGIPENVRFVAFQQWYPAAPFPFPKRLRKLGVWQKFRSPLLPDWEIWQKLGPPAYRPAKKLTLKGVAKPKSRKQRRIRRAAR